MCDITINRKTRETDISLALSPGGAAYSGSCGVGFLDHMLAAFCVHSGISISLSMTGDLEVDCHHSVEDLGIALGQALGQLAGDKTSIARYGSFRVPMDEALGVCDLDFSGRAYLVFDAAFQNPAVGALDCCMVREFFRALAMNAGLTLHLSCPYGDNDHHKIEALFKAFAHALAMALAPRTGGVLSSKGCLA